MNELQLRVSVQNTLAQIVADLMQSNHIPPHIMEDALNKVLLDIKESAYQELINAILREQQEKAAPPVEPDLEEILEEALPTKEE